MRTGWTKNRKWAQRTEAVEVLANNPNATGADVLAVLFNSDANALRAEARKLQGALATEKRREAEKLAREIAEHDAIAATADADAQAAKLAAEVDARLVSAEPTQAAPVTADVPQGKGNRKTA